MANKLTTIVDFEVTKAKASVSDFKSAMSEADGVSGKLKAGFGEASKVIQANAGAIALGAGTALVAFGVKAVGAFTDTAKAAIDLGAATGLSTEAASRWIGVGDDFQVSAEDLTSSIGKIGKTLDGKAWDKYGIATRDASGKARDANSILIDALATLSGITNETSRAKAGNELFGKGYAKLAPLIGHTKDEYEGMLGSVEKGQVITAAEAAKAEKFRLAEDQLGDALHEVTLEVGQQVAGIAPLLVGLAKLIGLLAELPTHILKFGGAGKITDTLYALHNEADRGGRSWEKYDSDVRKGKLTLDEAVAAIHAAAEAHIEVNNTLDGGEKSWEGTTDAVVDTTTAAVDLVKQQEIVNKAMADGKTRDDDYTKSLQDIRNAQLDLIPHTEDLAQAIRDNQTAYFNLQQQEAENVKTQKDHKVSTDEKAQANRDLLTSEHDLVLGILDTANTYATSRGDIEGSTQAVQDQINFLLIAKAQYPELATEIQLYIDKLNAIPPMVKTQVQLDFQGGKGETHAAGNPHLAEGGVVMPTPGGTSVTVAEAGKPEAIVPLDGKHGIGGPQITNHFHGITDPREMARQQAREIGWTLRST